MSFDNTLLNVYVIIFRHFAYHFIVFILLIFEFFKSIFSVQHMKFDRNEEVYSKVPADILPQITLIDDNNFKDYIIKLISERIYNRIFFIGTIFFAFTQSNIKYNRKIIHCFKLFNFG